MQHPEYLGLEPEEELAGVLEAAEKLLAPERWALFRDLVLELDQALAAEELARRAAVAARKAAEAPGAACAGQDRAA